MSKLPTIVPTSIPAAMKSLAAMERDIDRVKTYEQAKQIMRAAEAIKIMHREISNVRKRAERVMIYAADQIGAQLLQERSRGTAGNFLGGKKGSGRGIKKPGGALKAPPGSKPTYEQMVQSKKRGVRYVKLHKLTRKKQNEAIEEIQSNEKEATLDSVIRIIADWEGETRRNRSRDAAPLPDGCRLLTGDCRMLLAETPDNSVPLILTDPPYEAESEPLYKWLGEFAGRVLIPGGSLICYTGHWSLNRDMRIFDRHLRYWWLLAMLHHQSKRLPGKFIVAGFKPVLWYVKEFRRGRSLMPDVLKPPARDKELHNWGQGEGGVSQIIEHLTEPKELIIDPFCGTGKWGRIAANMGREFLGIDVVEGGATTVVADELNAAAE